MGTSHDDPAADAALARRIAAGAAGADAAEAELSRRLLPRVRAYGLRHLRDDAAAADLAQHVVLVVLEGLRAGRVQDLDRVAGFVMGVCRNTMLDWRKTAQRRSAILDRYGPTLATTEEVRAPSLDRERLVHCLEALEPRQRTIVVLTYYAEREPAQLARELAMSPGSVRVARHRALRRLHDCITRGGAS